jgi:hypothetical protein
MAAYWKEKMYFDEVFLNNLRKEGTVAQYEAAQKKLAKNMRSLRNRCDRRKEWMIAKMLTVGTISYLQTGGKRASVDYGIPSSQLVTLAANRHWNDGNSRNIVEDIFDAKLTLQNSNGAQLSNAIFTTEILKLMIFDPSIQTILQKSAFGDGDLFANPTKVLGSLLGIGKMILYDEQYQLKSWLTAAVTADSTTNVYVDDPSDFEAGGTLRFHDLDAGTYEDETISSVTTESRYITVSSAPSTSYKAQDDFVTMTKKFIPTDTFTLFADSVQGEMVAEFANAPYGLNRNYGMYVDQKEEWDPEGVYIRVQNKGLPVLYQNDAIYSLTVHD